MKKMKTFTRSRIAYIDATDFDHHLGEGNDPKPARLYASAALVLKGETCAKECGVYQVEVKFKKLVVKPTGRLGY